MYFVWYLFYRLHLIGFTRFTLGALYSTLQHVVYSTLFITLLSCHMLAVSPLFGMQQPDTRPVDFYWTVNFFNIFIAQTLYTTRVRTSYKIVPLTNMNEYLHNDISVTEVNLYVSVNNSSEKRIVNCSVTSLVAWWSELLTTSHEVPGSIPGSALGIFLYRGRSP
jgi:hypothetical protein